MVVSSNWASCIIDVNNAFVHGDLFEEVYMELFINKGSNLFVGYTNAFMD